MSFSESKIVVGHEELAYEQMSTDKRISGCIHKCTNKDLGDEAYAVFSKSIQNLNNIRDEEEAFGLVVAGKLTEISSQSKKTAIQTKIMMILNEEFCST